MIEWDPTQPRWTQVADVLRRRIDSGTYQKGGRVPSVQQLVAEFGIASVTAQKTLRALREEGLIVTTPGMGSFVA
jgi:GntR family transcriptional regulator